MQQQAPTFNAIYVKSFRRKRSVVRHLCSDSSQNSWTLETLRQFLKFQGDMALQCPGLKAPMSIERVSIRYALLHPKFAIRHQMEVLQGTIFVYATAKPSRP